MPVLFKPARYLSASDAVMANHHDVSILRQFVKKAGADPTHGSEHAALKMIDVGFPVLADIE